MLQHPLVVKFGPKFLRFLVCGGLGASIDFGTLRILVHTLHWLPQYAFILSTSLSLIFVFLSNRFFTFRGVTGDPKSQMMKFFLVYMSAAFLNYVLSVSLTFMGINYMLAKALAIGILMFFNFFFLNSFVFRKLHVEADEGIEV